MKKAIIPAILILAPFILGAQEDEKTRRHEISLQPISPFVEERTSTDFNFFLPEQRTKKYYPVGLQYRYHLNDKYAARLAYRFIHGQESRDAYQPFTNGQQDVKRNDALTGNQLNLGFQRQFVFSKFSFYTGFDVLYYQEEMRFREETEAKVQPSGPSPGYHYISESSKYNLTHSYGVAMPLGMTYAFTSRCGILLEASIDYRKGTWKRIDETYGRQFNTSTGEMIHQSWNITTEFDKPSRLNIFKPSQARIMVYCRF